MLDRIEWAKNTSQYCNLNVAKMFTTVHTKTLYKSSISQKVDWKILLKLSLEVQDPSRGWRGCMDVYFIMHLSFSYIVYTVEYGKLAKDNVLHGKENNKRKKQIIFYIYYLHRHRRMSCFVARKDSVGESRGPPPPLLSSVSRSSFI